MRFRIFHWIRISIWFRKNLHRKKTGSSEFSLYMSYMINAAKRFRSILWDSIHSWRFIIKIWWTFLNKSSFGKFFLLLLLYNKRHFDFSCYKFSIFLNYSIFSPNNHISLLTWDIALRFLIHVFKLSRAQWRNNKLVRFL